MLPGNFYNSRVHSLFRCLRQQFLPSPFSSHSPTLFFHPHSELMAWHSTSLKIISQPAQNFHRNLLTYLCTHEFPPLRTLLSTLLPLINHPCFYLKPYSQLANEISNSLLAVISPFLIPSIFPLFKKFPSHLNHSHQHAVWCHYLPFLKHENLFLTPFLCQLLSHFFALLCCKILKMNYL